MKYIKLFESVNKYKVGDYVVVVLKLADINGHTIPGEEKFLEIMEVDNDVKYYSCKLLFYKIEGLCYALTDQNIVRKIEDYEIKAMQYNL